MPIERLFTLIFVLMLLGTPRSFGAEYSTPPPSPLHYAYPTNRALTIDGSLLGDCLAIAVIDSGSFEMSKQRMNQPYNYQKFSDYLIAAFGKNGKRYMNSPSDQLVGPKASTYFRTGTEETLKKWILSQPENSITPPALLKASMTINHHNVWNAVLAIHDLLRNNARFFDYHRYSYKTTVADANALFNKLIDLRGDLRERGGAFTGDHEGSWYRIWVLFLARMIAEPEELPRACPASHGVFDSVENLVRPAYSGLIDYALLNSISGELAKPHIGEPDIDMQGKYQVDKAALWASGSFVRELWHTPKNVASNPAIRRLCDKRGYLKTKP